MHNLAFSLSQAGLNFKGIIDYILSIIGLLNPILFTLAFLLFFWGLSKFILSSGSAAEVEKGKSYMIWGILALFILLTFMAIIRLVSNDLELGPNTNPNSVLPTDTIAPNTNVNLNYNPN